MKKLLYLLILPLLVIGCGTSNASSSNNKASSSVKDSSPKPSDTPSVSQTTSIEKEDGYIYDEQDLINIKNDLSATYYLANDITLTKEWVTIGDKENPFTGTIDGRGFTINNLKITNSLSMTEETSSLGRDFISTGGLVGYLTGSINNLNLKNYSIELENQLISEKDCKYEFNRIIIFLLFYECYIKDDEKLILCFINHWLINISPFDFIHPQEEVIPCERLLPETIVSPPHSHLHL